MTASAMIIEPTPETTTGSTTAPRRDAARRRRGRRLEMRRASREQMEIAADILRSTADWYRPFLSEEDMKEHDVGPEWAEENYGKRVFHLAWDEGEPVGVLSTQDAGNDLYVGYVYVFEDRTGFGYGPQLLDHAERRARAAGKDGLVLIAHPEATWATKAYRRFGFERIASERRDVLAWNDGWLEPYYEEGFELYRYALPQPTQGIRPRSTVGPMHSQEVRLHV